MISAAMARGKNAGLQMFDKRQDIHQFHSDPALAGTLADDRVNCLFWIIRDIYGRHQ